MKKFLLINLSPRRKGTSVMLGEMCREYLEQRRHQAVLIHLHDYLNDPSKLLKAVGDSDTVILTGPCYVDTYPADTVAFLELLSDSGALRGQDLYGIIQGGMPYAHTHDSGLTMLSCFGRKCRVQYKGGFALGFGAMLNGQPVSRLPNAKKVMRQLKVFFEHIEKGEESPRSVYEAAQMKLPKFVCRLMSGWMNRHIDRDLRAHGVDPRQPSTYLSEVS